MNTYLIDYARQLQKYCRMYFRGTPWPWIFAGALLACVLLAVIKKERKAAFMAVYTILTAVIVLSPVGYAFIGKLIGQDIYWRIIWFLPILPITCYAASAWIRLLPDKGIPARILRIAATLGVCCIIALSGSLHYTSGDFWKTVNDLQIPDDVYQIGELINADRAADGRAEETITVAAEDYTAAYLRLYDPTIAMPFGRRAQGAATKNARRLYYRLQKGDYPKKMAKRAHSLNCDYIVIQTGFATEQYLKTVTKRGYDYLGEAGSYTILKENAEYAARLDAKAAEKKAASEKETETETAAEAESN